MFSGPKPQLPYSTGTTAPLMNSADATVLMVLRDIASSLKENTAVTREAWAAVLSQQQPEAPLMQSDFEVKDLTVHDDDGYVAPHDRLMRLVQATQGMDGHTPVHFLVEGTIYSLGIEQKDLMGLIARVR